MIRLLIFDLDDTLVSSRCWVPAETRLFNLLGHSFQPELAVRYKGMNARDVARTIYDYARPADYTPEECGRLLRTFLLESARDGTVPRPGAEELLRAVSGKYRLAVASGSPVEVIRLMLDQFGWLPLFSLLVSSEEVPRGKPAPDVFLETLRRAGCPPNEALVIEDSLFGVRAAKAGGIRCFVAPSSDDPRIIEAADRAFPTLAEMVPALAGGEEAVL
ncbi:MAG: HAD family hydrolase [Armatimonadota bacterium]